MKPAILKTNIVYPGIIIIYVILELLFLSAIPDVMVDEPWYADTAYNFSQGQGFVNTNVGQYGGDFFILYTFLLGIGIKVFGCTLFVTRMISVIAGIIALTGLISILRSLKASSIITALTLMMFISSNVTYIIFRSTRPEGWILAFGIWSIFYLIKFINSNETRHILFGSIFATFSFLCHPNGVFFLISIGLYLIVYSINKKNISKISFFISTAFTITLIHFVIVFSNPDISFKEFINQLGSRNSISDSNFNLFNNFANFFSNYTLGIKRLYILIFEIGVLILGLFFSNRNFLLKYFSIFGILSLILSLILFSDYSSRHFGEIIIYSLLAFVLLAELSKQKKIRYVVIFLGVIYLVNNIGGDAYLIYKKHKNTPYSTIEKQLSDIIPENSTVISPLIFWYPLKTTQYYNEFTRWKFKPYADLKSLIQSNDIEYIVLSNRIIKGITGTSGRVEKIPEYAKEFFQQASAAIETNGILIDRIFTIGYDTIKIYRMRY